MLIHGDCVVRRYILENEEDIPEVDKRWVVNRIVVKEEEDRIIKLLKDHKQKFIHVPVVLEVRMDISRCLLGAF